MMFRTLPQFGADPRNVSEIVRQIMNGKTNNTGTVTLATGNATTTTLFDERISPDTKIVLVPFSAAANSNNVPYGAFQDSTSQTALANSSNVMTFNTTDYSNNISVVTSGGKASRLTVKDAGIYNLQWSGQFQNTANEGHDITVWLRKNGTDIAGSSGRIHMKERKNATDFYHLIVGWNYFVELAANEYVELWWSPQSATISIEAYAAGTSPTRPSTASVVATLTPVNGNSFGNVYVSSQTKGSAVISHYANSTANKTYGYILVG